MFFLLPLPASLYEKTGVRIEEENVARVISEEHRHAYAEFGLEVVEIPPVSVVERMQIIGEVLQIKTGLRASL